MARAVVQRLRGLVPYGRALELQERLAAGLRAGERPAAGGREAMPRSIGHKGRKTKKK